MKTFTHSLTLLTIEFGSILLFALTSLYASFYVATLVFVLATICSLGYAGYVQHRIAWFPLLSGLSIVGMGFLTLVLADPSWIILRDTLFEGGLALILIITLSTNQLIFKSVFSYTFALSDEGWKKISWNWVIWLILLAIGNQYVGTTYPPETWVLYKAGTLIPSGLFVLYQLFCARKYRLSQATKWGFRRK